MNSPANNSHAVARMLALTVCLFSLSVQLTALASSARPSSVETLAGLQDIALIVKYGEVNGPQAEWQATVLEKFETRARQQLKDAGIRVLPPDESSTGRPKLLFTLTLNRVDPTAAPVSIQTELYQRVRLWRDAAKELELPTWTTSGVGGPEVTQKMLSDVFDGQLERFLKDYQSVNATVPTEKIPVSSAPLSDNAQGFAGLNSTRLFLSIREDMFSDARQAVLQKFLQEAAETRLKEAGIKVNVYADESDRAGHALLYIWIKLSKPNVQTWAPPIGVESTFSQTVRLARDPKKQSEAATWESRAQGDFVKNSNGDLVVTDDAVLELVNKQVDEFIKALKAASPWPKAQNGTAP